MEGLVYWIATVSNEDGLHASDLIFWDGATDPDELFGLLSEDTRLASSLYGAPVEWFGPLTLPAAT